MKKDFKQELTELINKHSLEKEMRDTPDFILAQVCIDAMAVFSEELERIKETGTIHLSVATFNQPLQPVLLTVDLPTEK